MLKVEAQPCVADGNGIRMAPRCPLHPPPDDALLATADCMLHSLAACLSPAYFSMRTQSALPLHVPFWTGQHCIFSARTWQPVTAYPCKLHPHCMSPCSTPRACTHVCQPPATHPPPCLTGGGGYGATAPHTWSIWPLLHALNPMQRPFFLLLMWRLMH